jgi:PmbA protein
MTMGREIERIIGIGLSNGADEVEIFERRIQTIQVKTEGGKIKNNSKWLIETIIRVIIEKSIATAYITTDNTETIKETLLRTIRLARNSEPDPYWRGLPTPEKQRRDIRSWNQELTRIDQTELTKRIKKDIEHIKRLDKRVKPVTIEYTLNNTSFTIANSNGLYTIDRYNGLNYIVDLKAKEGSRESATFGYKRTRFGDIDSTEIIEETVNRAVELLNAEKYGKKYTGPILLDPTAAATTLYFSLARVITGIAVQEGYSPLANKIGETITDKKLTIIDEGLLKDGWNTRRYDDEGVPRNRTEIISKGILKGFIHNSYTANRMGGRSTGNARRRGATLGIDISNLVISPGTKTLDQLTSTYDELILIKNMPMGAHTTNYMTGTVNMVATEVYHIKQGGVEKILKPLTVTGNIYKALRRVEIGRDASDTFLNIYTPPLILTGLTLA